MRKLLAPEKLLVRIELWAEEEVRGGALHPSSMMLLREAIHTGSLERGRVTTITGFGERQGRVIVSKLVDRGVLTAPTHRAPLTLGFPIDVLERWFPGLYPPSGK